MPFGFGTAKTAATLFGIVCSFQRERKLSVDKNTAVKIETNA
jgi:hypothetical protein